MPHGVCIAPSLLGIGCLRGSNIHGSEIQQRLQRLNASLTNYLIYETVIILAALGFPPL